MCSPNIQIDDLSLPRHSVHEAGHAVVAAVLSNDPVCIEVGSSFTDEGHRADAMCVSDWKQEDNESVEHLFERRIAVLFAATIAEAYFEEPAQFESRALNLWMSGYGARGDHAKVCRICAEEMPSCGIVMDGQKIRTKAWSIALSTVQKNALDIAKVAKASHSKGSLTNEEIRALLTTPAAL
jgi:pentatricopeptide repeat protein